MFEPIYTIGLPVHELKGVQIGGIYRRGLNKHCLKTQHEPPREGRPTNTLTYHVIRKTNKEKRTYLNTRKGYNKHHRLNYKIRREKKGRRK